MQAKIFFTEIYADAKNLVPTHRQSCILNKFKRFLSFSLLVLRQKELIIWRLFAIPDKSFYFVFTGEIAIIKLISVTDIQQLYKYILQ
jgi:hypothetical protein